jgi:hypothetical protein
MRWIAELKRRLEAMVMFNDAGRNDPCPCGSGKKFKKCCLTKAEETERNESVSFLSHEEAKRVIKDSQRYPLDRCLVNKGWQEKGMANIIVVRRQEDSSFILGGYLVDLLCLGVKNAFCNAGISQKDLDENLTRIRQREPFEAIDFNFAKEIIFGGLEYARNLGFEPNADFKLARDVLGTDPLTHDHEIHFGGPGGKPLFVSGPDDDEAAILEKLSKR